MKKFIFIFTLAFALNLIWENLHARFYVNYKGGPITEWILVRATFWDAVIITVLCRVAFYFKKEWRIWIVAIGGLLIAILMEKWALGTGRWIYTSAMPILPWVHTGFTPTIQLALLGSLVFWFIKKKSPDQD